MTDNTYDDDDDDNNNDKRTDEKTDDDTVTVQYQLEEEFRNQQDRQETRYTLSFGYCFLFSKINVNCCIFFINI